jgi:predicted transposase/invertase (TIGR01784 family)
MLKDKILGKDINEIINFCIGNDFIASYLKKFSFKVFKMLKAEYSLKMEIEDAREEALKEGEIKRELKGKIEGKIEAKTEIALKMLESNFPIAQINDLLGLSIDKIEN